MKGLLMRDLHITWHLGRAVLAFAVAFGLLSAISDDFTFFTFYPCLLVSLLPLSVLSTDERTHWDLYADLLPCSRAQQVSVKYLLNLLCTAGAVVFITLCQLVRQLRLGSFSLGELLFFPLVMLALSLFSNAICFPFAFRFGMEKGRLIYFCLIGVFGAVSFLLSSDFGVTIIAAVLSIPLTPAMLLALVLLAVLAVFAFSWRVSVVLYRKRELN